MEHSLGFLKIVADSKTRIREMDIARYRELAESGTPFVLVDVREESEFAAGHPAGAIHLSKGVIERDIEGRIPDHEATIVVLCGGGYRSALVADNLQKMGYLQVISLDGGWRAWKAAGLATET